MEVGRFQKSVTIKKDAQWKKAAFINGKTFIYLLLLSASRSQLLWKIEFLYLTSLEINIYSYTDTFLFKPSVNGKVTSVRL